eukprot:CAMPEP_0206282214 /NCGR_PEP_ID=MMETSP0047_2-20121206/39568_1 /ASSEMBLY_ACC=CAM_ASM_000192 /TAXON_ID=195065 /ORGANISM="Chroomonas mesostigmatica_cf, Strain CCMP1168" /LENGTH=49 /DNA_ID=CAMNT_0053712479 /DNA_START=399 /DNA_END=547 /DNA_ORIENTATION=-
MTALREVGISVESKAHDDNDAEDEGANKVGSTKENGLHHESPVAPAEKV